MAKVTDANGAPTKKSPKRATQMLLRAFKLITEGHVRGVDVPSKQEEAREARHAAVAVPGLQRVELNRDPWTQPGGLAQCSSAGGGSARSQTPAGARAGSPDYYGQGAHAQRGGRSAVPRLKRKQAAPMR